MKPLVLRPHIRRLSIKTKGQTIERFPIDSPFAWAQRELCDAVETQYNDGKPVRIISLKARQLGISTVTQAIMYVLAFRQENSYGLTVAHEAGSSDMLFEKTRLYWDTWPFGSLYSAKYQSRREVTWHETGSSLRTSTARNVKATRGQTVNLLHASEVAFWDQPEQTMTALRQTVPDMPGSLIVLESTANGVGNWFHDTWEAAVAGDVEYIPLFAPWWRHYEYSSDYVEAAQRIVLAHLDEEERLLQRLGVTDPYLRWRRWAINNKANGDIELFHQEYPSTAEEAFITSGRNVFPLAALQECYEPKIGKTGDIMIDGVNPVFVENRFGHLTLYKLPSRNRAYGQYLVAGDPTQTTYGDYACIQVINRRNFEQMAVWHGRCDSVAFASRLAEIGKFYNNAIITTEVEGPGWATIGALVTMNYPNIWHHKSTDRYPGPIGKALGWSTNAKRKDQAIANLLYCIKEQRTTIHHGRTFDEMRNYVIYDRGDYGPADERNGYDDCVMAYAIALTCSIMEGPVDDTPEARDYFEPDWMRHEPLSADPYGEVV